MLLAHDEQNAWPQVVTKKSAPSIPNSVLQFGLLHCIWFKKMLFEKWASKTAQKWERKSIEREKEMRENTINNKTSEEKERERGKDF